MRVKICAILLVAALPVPAWAHHSVAATFDRTASISVSGVVTRIEWRNPHVVIHINFKVAGLDTVRHVEMGGPAGVERRGLRRIDVRIGEAVTFQAWAPKPGAGWTDWLNGQTLTLADGRRFDVSDRFGGGAYE